MSGQETKMRIRLAREIGGVAIEVWLESEDRFRESYALLTKLCRRAVMEEARESAERVWIREAGSKRLAESVSSSVHRVGLSLYEDWPEPKKVVDIQTETELSQSSVSQILSGKQGGAGDWFERTSDKWKLSQVGESKILQEVVPGIGMETTKARVSQKGKKEPEPEAQ